MLEESIRLRTGDRRSCYPNPLARRRDLLAFGRMVIDDAHRRHAARQTGARPGRLALGSEMVNQSAG